jgi:hypothetical protein
MSRPSNFLKMHGVAIAYHCRFAFETAHPRFIRVARHPVGPVSIILTVNSGYE